MVDLTLNYQDAPSFFGPTMTPGEGSVLSSDNATFLEKHGRSLAVSSIALQGLAQTMGGKAQVENIFANVERTQRNIDQMEVQLIDALGIQARKVSKRHGTQMARVGASGVALAGSPLMVMAENHARGMQDYEAIEQKGLFAIESAYQSIYDQLDQAKDVGTGMIVSGFTTLASAAFTAGMTK